LVTVSGLTGRVAAADEHAVTLLVDGASRVLRYDELGPGRVQVEFDRPAAGVDAAEGDTT
jgi:ribosome maturation factor RimP